MESIKHGFIKPDGTTIEVPKENFGAFCKIVCFKYMEVLNENKLIFKEYNASYPEFIPYFQFIIDILNWKYVGSIFDEKQDYQINTDDYSLLNGINFSDFTEGENGFILHDGKFITSNVYSIDHDQIAKKILFSIMINNDAVYNDYTDPMLYHYNIFSDYLINRLHFIKLGSYLERKTLEYVYDDYDRILTSKQKELRDKLKFDFGYKVREITNYTDDARKVKELIRKYRG